MATLNQCTFIGNLGRDPESRFAANGMEISNFSIAVSESWTDKATNERKEKTEWVRITAFGKLAEICNKYLRKGSPVWVQGKMQTRKWQGQDGQDKYTTEILADSMQMLGGRGDDAGQSYQQPQQQPSQPQAAAQPKRNYQAAPPAGGMADMDDDIPFAPLFARNAYCI